MSDQRPMRIRYPSFAELHIGTWFYFLDLDGPRTLYMKTDDAEAIRDGSSGGGRVQVVPDTEVCVWPDGKTPDVQIGVTKGSR